MHNLQHKINRLVFFYEALRWAYHNAQMDSTNINSIKIVRIIEPYKIKSKFFGSKFFKFFRFLSGK